MAYKVRKIDRVNNDWTFGQGLSNYHVQNDTIMQNIKTRILEIKGDWFLDIQKGINWYYYLGSKGVETDMINSIRNVVLATEGVLRVDDITYNKKTAREGVLTIEGATIYDEKFIESLGIRI